MVDVAARSSTAAPKTSPPLLSCTIITTDAAGPLAEIHDRMPLTISASDWDRWLDPDAPIDEGSAARARRPGPDRDSRGVAAGQQHPQQRSRADRTGKAGAGAGNAVVGVIAARPSPPHRERRRTRCRQRRRARAKRPQMLPAAGRAWRHRHCPALRRASAIRASRSARPHRSFPIAMCGWLVRSRGRRNRPPTGR